MLFVCLFAQAVNSRLRRNSAPPPDKIITENHARKQIWSISHGVAIADEATPNSAQLMKSGSSASIPLATQPKIHNAGKRYLSQGGQCLCFFGYFKEAVYESQIEVSEKK